MWCLRRALDAWNRGLGLRRGVAGPPRAGSLIVGLGNRGARYRRTRHNAGALFLDFLAAQPGGPAAALATGGAPVDLLLPSTYMNVSGRPVVRKLRELGLAPTQLVLVQDDLDLPLGRVRIKHQGAARGHRGVASVVASLRTDEIARIRIGIGRPEHRHQVSDYCLADFSADEMDTLHRDAFPLALQRLREVLGTS